MRHHLAFLEPTPSGGFSVIFPDFPGCATQGDNLEDARRMAHEALEGHVAVMVEFGDPIPEPIGLEAAVRHEDYPGTVALLAVPLDSEEAKG